MSSTMITFNTDGMAIQRFPFPAPIMDYIFKNVQPQHLLKLYQCCKFFYAKYRFNIIRNLSIVNENDAEIFDPSSTIIRFTNPVLQKLQNFWITDTFFYRAPSNDYIFLPFFSHCTIKKLNAYDFLEWEEFEALTRSGTIEELRIDSVYRNGNSVPIEELIAQVPNATSIHITASETTPTTFATMAALHGHKGKITNFILENLIEVEHINFDLIFKYLLKNADLDCYVHFCFQLEDGEHDIVRQYNQALKDFGFSCTERIVANLNYEKGKRALESALALLS